MSDYCHANTSVRSSLVKRIFLDDNAHPIHELAWRVEKQRIARLDIFEGNHRAALLAMNTNPPSHFLLLTSIVEIPLAPYNACFLVTHHDTPLDECQLVAHRNKDPNQRVRGFYLGLSVIIDHVATFRKSLFVLLRVVR